MELEEQTHLDALKAYTSVIQSEPSYHQTMQVYWQQIQAISQSYRHTFTFNYSWGQLDPKEVETKKVYNHDRGTTKAWESPYGAMSRGAIREKRITVESLERLPAGQVVAFKRSSNEDFVSMEESIWPWLKSHDIHLLGHFQKKKGGEVLLDTFFFKRKKDAMFFKLVWG